MIISLTVKNWMSFKDETPWVLVASKERIHRDRIPKKGRLAISPIAAIFGPNASGKTNLIEAIRLIQNMVINGHTASSVIAYAFSSNNEPTTIELEILINDRVYVYTVYMTKERIINEELSEIRANKSICLFRREVASDLTQKYHFPNLKCDERIKKFTLIGNKTATNKLFLHRCGDKNVCKEKIVCEYDHIINWFHMLFVSTKNSSTGLYLSCISDEIMSSLIHDQSISEEFAEWLHDLDTDIIKLDLATITDPIKNIFFKTGTKELVAIHRNYAGGEVPLSVDLLSSGTKELITFLVLLMLWKNGKRVFFIDEFGQNFHNDLFKALIELCLSYCGPKTRSQLIFTTHNQSVMTQSLLRLDEMWVVEKHGNKSTLYSFVEFEGLSSRTDVAKRYRQGHLGGLPNL